MKITKPLFSDNFDNVARILNYGRYFIVTETRRFLFKVINILP